MEQTINSMVNFIEERVKPGTILIKWRVRNPAPGRQGKQYISVLNSGTSNDEEEGSKKRQLTTWHV